MAKPTLLFFFANLIFPLFIITSLNVSPIFCYRAWRRPPFPYRRPLPPPPPTPPQPLPHKISTVLIFGDSTVDTGNNNHLSTVFKANFPPYGQDFPGHVATGRFSNGKLVPDFLASMLGIKDTVPPYLDPGLRPRDLLTGVSFASAGSGYDERTSTGFTNVIPVLKQVDLFRRYIERVEGLVEEAQALEIVNAALVLVAAGTNDMTFNFYDVPSTTNRRAEFNLSGYHHFLQNNLGIFVKRMLITGLPPIGCLPIQKATRNSQSCVKQQNKDALSYNKKLKKLLPILQSELPRSRLIFGDIYKPFLEMIRFPKKYGFAEVSRGCCGTGRSMERSMLCNRKTPKCHNASQYVFWDSIHPSQATYELASKRILLRLLPELT
ncbi:unnamed protein product [Linum tenue]|uniref:Uncharacterized protein n=1 Tax=Linum tenue TaxID=586396 RepID=A0AAV0LZ03_9ROSI|nr:unnamed protein product [Linum tenue]